jgi:photosystem II stability/assembly factor-like uncharacterized protein
MYTMMIRSHARSVFLASLCALGVYADAAFAWQGRLEAKDTLKSSQLAGLQFRNIGPAMISGRVSDFAVDPRNRSHYYAAVASGGVWRTENAGTTWKPVFDGEGAYSIGCVALDPTNPFTVWVGTGEANSQRSVSYGDGIYKSEDGGASWKNMGLRKSEHIAVILFDPRNHHTMYVAAQGPLWAPGGDRGLYKTTDGGATWVAVLTVSENTGVTDVVMDPRDPEVLYAASYQRRRHRWTMINGGPESAIHKSTDGGKTWKKLSRGLPGVDLGRIGLAISPVNPDVLYATVEAEGDAGGIFRSTNRGASWERRNPYVDTQMYYGRIWCDPVDVDRIYVAGTIMQVSDDGGTTVERFVRGRVHVDFHAFWIDPADPEYYLLGTDGGVYESFDRGGAWQWKSNLPTAQFYRVTVDNTTPFYYVYGGTQDNATVGGPSQTTNSAGIRNGDWFVTIGGDGFETQVDPTDPSIVYSQYQYGGLARYDRRTGEVLWIQPIEEQGEGGLRWNWDSPLVISPHNPTRLYFAANKVFRSDDRGATWTKVSGDLTRQIDRNTLPVMGKVWGPEAINKHGNTAIWGNVSFLSESPLKEGLLYAGTDDGLIQVSADGGTNWRKIEEFPGVPELAYVSSVHASLFDENVVYATFDHHQTGDFTPYVLKSTNQGKSWTSISANLPKNGVVHALAQDHVDPNLLFVGTEFGLFVTVDGGAKWTALTGGVPTIAIMDIDIHRAENDLVLATFGRGFYILDDYTPLRAISSATLQREAHLFPVQDAALFVESFQAESGDDFYRASNPPFGASVTYFLKESYKSTRQTRREAEKEAAKKAARAVYPTLDQLQKEADEEPPSVVVTITNAAGELVRRVPGKNSAGINRVTWDLSLVSPQPITRGSASEAERSGWLAMPGSYAATLSKVIDGTEMVIAGPEPFSAVPVVTSSVPVTDPSARAAFMEKATRLQKAALGALELLDDITARVRAARVALGQTPGATPELAATLRTLDQDLTAMQRAFRGSEVTRRYNENQSPSIMDRIGSMVSAFWASMTDPTTTQKQAYAIAADEFDVQLKTLREIAEVRIPAIEKELNASGAPWTPWRVPVWSKEN